MMTAKPQSPSVTTTAFSPSRIRELRALLGDKLARRLLPEFERAVQNYRPTEVWSDQSADDRRRAARKHEATAKELELLARRLIRALSKADPLLRDAFAIGYLPADDASVPSAGEDAVRPNAPEGESSEELRATLEALCQQVRTWQAEAHVDSQRKRGRTYGIRPVFGAWIAERLILGGIRFSTDPDGLVGRALTVMYDAAGIDAPVDLYRELQRVKKRLELRSSGPLH